MLGLLALLVLLGAPQADPTRLDPKIDLLTGPYLRPDQTAKYGYLELSYPKAFQTDGHGPLKTKPLIQSLSVSVNDDLREWVSFGSEGQEDRAVDKETLGSICKVLASHHVKSRIVPYMDRYLATRAKAGYLEMLEYIAGLARLGRTAEAYNHYYQSVLRWGAMSENMAGELYSARFQMAWHVEKNFPEMVTALRDGMKRGLFPADKNIMQDSICDLVRQAGERGELPWFASRLEKDWIWINDRRLKGILEVFAKAGVAPSDSLLTAADPLFKGGSVAPEALLQRAIISLDVTETELAVRQAERGYELAKASSPGQHFQSLILLTRILRHRGDLERAFQVTEEAEQVAKKINDRPEIGWALVMKGFILARLSDHKGAATHLDQAMQIGAELEYEELQSTARLALASSLSHVGMGATMETVLREHAEGCLSGRQFTMIPGAFLRWGDSLLQMRRYDEALKAYRRALEPVKGAGSDYPIEFLTQVDCHKGIAQSLLGMGKFDEAEKAYAAYAAVAAKGNSASADWAWQLGKAKCRLGLKDAEGGKELIERCLASIETERASLRDFQNRRSLNDNKYEAYELAIRLALDAKDPAGAFRIAERSRARSFLDQMGTAPSTPGEAAGSDLAALAEACRDESLVIYYQLPDRLLAWVVSGGKSELVTIDLTADELRRHIENFLYSIYLQSLTLQDKARVFGPRPDVINSGKGLYQALWTALDGKLPAGKPVCIVAHGALHYVPFQALRNGKKHLIEERELFHAPSATAYLALKRRPCEPGPKVLVFDPILSDDPKSPFSKTESAGLRARYPEGTFVVKKEATVEAFRAQAPGSGLIHVSSHGYYNPWVPMASGLLFAGVKGEEHGILTAKDIYGMELKKTELIIMSACVSSVGDFATGDEVTGLTRAFQVAGVPNVIGSLWPVENEATIELMGLFHQALAESRNPSEALRKAQMQMIARQSPVVKWAAFQLTGLGGPLKPR